MSRATLTDGAVLAAPSVQAAAAPPLVAGVVAEGVVARPAVGGARLSVVVLVAQHVVRVAELALVPKVHVLGPLISDGEPAPRRQAADQIVLVLCEDGEDLMIPSEILSFHLSAQSFVLVCRGQ